jgi:hypothetical protein
MAWSLDTPVSLLRIPKSGKLPFVHHDYKFGSVTASQIGLGAVCSALMIVKIATTFGSAMLIKHLLGCRNARVFSSFNATRILSGTPQSDRSG